MCCEGMAFLMVPAIAACVLLSLSLYKYILQPAFLSPLSKIPAAHWSARYSPLWILWRRYHSQNNATTLAAHQSHGPIVLLGPNELSINCVDEGIRTVYGGGFEKHDWYPRLFPSYGVINMFSTVGHAEHAAKKRLMSNVYSKSYLQNSAQIQANSHALITQRLLPLIQKLSETGESINVHEMNNAFTVDFMSAYQFGLRNSTNFFQDAALRKKNLHEYYCRKDYEFYHQEVPWLRDAMRWLGRPLVPDFCGRANAYMEEWNGDLCAGAEKTLLEKLDDDDKVSPPGDDPVVYRQFRTGFAKLTSAAAGGKQTDAEVQRREVASEMLDHLSAGHETSAIALTYIYYELSRHPALQAQLRDEIRSLSPPLVWPPAPPGSVSDMDRDSDRISLPSAKAIDSLPLLHAVVMETLRLHTPIPGTEPRVTPAVPGGCTLAGYKGIPGGVRVAAMPYTLHRNGDVFPAPGEWRPRRWMGHGSADGGGDGGEDDESRREMLRWFWAFGSGGRMCIGSNLAMQEMKLIVCAIYGNYRTEIVNDEGIEEIDAYSIRPRRNALDLRFVKVG